MDFYLTLRLHTIKFASVCGELRLVEGMPLRNDLCNAQFNTKQGGRNQCPKRSI